MKTVTTLLIAVTVLAGCSKQPETKTLPDSGIPVELRDPNRLWCKEHNRYEDRCWLCHPELQDKSRLYCEEHGLYEDECFLCHPELKAPSARESGVPAATGQRLMCKEHGVFEDECGICHPELTAQLKSGESMKVRLPATDSAKLVGVETATPGTGAMAEGISCLAEIAYDQNKLAQITAPVSGVIQSVDADLGALVKEYESLAKIWSASIAETVAKAVLSHQTLERERKLRADGIAPAKDLQEAEAAHRAACQQARTLGFSEADIEAMGKRPDDAVFLEIRAPFAGEIIERNAVRGALVEAGKALFTVADRSTMWAMLSVPEAAVAQLQVGQEVELQVDALPGKTLTGKLTWIAAEVDEKTRLAKARAEINNPDGELRARMFARARVLTRANKKALVLPPAALQQVEDATVVFVKLADDLFEARRVRVGAKHNGHVEILDGLQPGESVVVAQGFTLKSQLLISRLGAGCAHE